MAEGRRRGRSLLSVRRWPVRWRLAGVSAGLTLLILVVFALVVGQLASNASTVPPVTPSARKSQSLLSVSSSEARLRAYWS